MHQEHEQRRHQQESAGTKEKLSFFRRTLDKTLDSFGIGKRWEREAQYLAQEQQLSEEEAHETAFVHTVEDMQQAAQAETADTRAQLEAEEQLLFDMLGPDHPAIAEIKVLEADIAKDEKTWQQQVYEMTKDVDAHIAAERPRVMPSDDIEELSSDDLEILGDADDPSLAHIEAGTYTQVEADKLYMEQIENIAEDDLEILGDIDDPSLAHIEAGTYAPDAVPEAKKDSGEYEDSAIDARHASSVTQETIDPKLLPEKEELHSTEQLDTFFRKLIPQAMTEYDARDVQSGRAPDCYLNMDPGTAAALQSIIASAPTLRSKPFLFFSQFERSGPNGLGYVTVNLQERDWQQTLKSTLEGWANKETQRKNHERTIADVRLYMSQKETGNARIAIPWKEARAALASAKDADRVMLKEYIDEARQIEKLMSRHNADVFAKKEKKLSTHELERQMDMKSREYSRDEETLAHDLRRDIRALFDTHRMPGYTLGQAVEPIVSDIVRIIKTDMRPPTVSDVYYMITEALRIDAGDREPNENAEALAEDVYEKFLSLQGTQNHRIFSMLEQNKEIQRLFSEWQEATTRERAAA